MSSVTAINSINTSNSIMTTPSVLAELGQLKAKLLQDLDNHAPQSQIDQDLEQIIQFLNSPQNQAAIASFAKAEGWGGETSPMYNISDLIQGALNCAHAVLSGTGGAQQEEEEAGMVVGNLGQILFETTHRSP